MPSDTATLPTPPALPGVDPVNLANPAPAAAVVEPVAEPAAEPATVAVIVPLSPAVALANMGIVMPGSVYDVTVPAEAVKQAEQDPPQPVAVEPAVVEPAPAEQHPADEGRDLAYRFLEFTRKLEGEISSEPLAMARTRIVEAIGFVERHLGLR